MPLVHVKVPFLDRLWLTLIATVLVCLGIVLGKLVPSLAIRSIAALVTALLLVGSKVFPSLIGELMDIRSRDATFVTAFLSFLVFWTGSQFGALIAPFRALKKRALGKETDAAAE